MNTFSLDIRERRQVTLPSELLKKLGAEVGDSIEVKVKEKEKTATMKSKKQLALEAFKELQKIFKESGVSEAEMLKEVDKQRLAEAKRFYNGQT